MSLAAFLWMPRSDLLAWIRFCDRLLHLQMSRPRFQDVWSGYFLIRRRWRISKCKLIRYRQPSIDKTALRCGEGRTISIFSKKNVAVTFRSCRHGAVEQEDCSACGEIAICINLGYYIVLYMAGKQLANHIAELKRALSMFSTPSL